MSEEQPAMAAAARPSAPQLSQDVVSQYLTFMLAGQEYGVDILRVQEIKGWEGVTRVPHTPDFLLGVMNLRGTIVPVVDLRARFEFERVPFGQGTVVIVVRVQLGRSEKTVGLVVDGVADVYNFSAADVCPPPVMQARSDLDVIGGLASAGEKMVMLLDVDRLVASSLDANLRVGPTH